MPRLYPPEEKAAALVQLERNSGNIALTHLQTGIPERTLQNWRRKIQLQDLRWRPAAPPPQKKEVPEFEDDLEALAYMRQQIMSELLNIAANLQDGFALSLPHQRLQILGQLLDRLAELDERLKPYQEPDRVVISWSMGLYIHGPEGRLGPYQPDDLPPNWREKWGPNAFLEIYWGFGLVSILSEGEVMNTVLDSHLLTEEEADQILVEPDFDREHFDSDEEYWAALYQYLAEAKRRKAVERVLKPHSSPGEL